MKVETKISFYLANSTIRIFKSTIRFMEEPKYIRFRVSEDRRSMILEPYHKKTFTSFKIPKNLFEYGGSMQVHSKAFCDLLAAQLNWDTDCSYRIVGGLIHKPKKMAIFDLTSAEVIRQD